MHDCPDCGELCDCDGEDHYNEAASATCSHECDPDDDPDVEAKDDPDLANDFRRENPRERD